MKIGDLAPCCMKPEREEGWIPEWTLVQPFTESRIQKFQPGAEPEATSEAHLIERDQVYELLGSFIEHEGKDRAVKEVIVTTRLSRQLHGSTSKQRA